MASPLDTVATWLAAHRRGDLAAARALLADDATIEVMSARLVGFDALMHWYRDRAAEAGPGFGYEVVDLLAGEHHAAAVLELHTDAAVWRQFALYEVRRGEITSIWAAEDFGGPTGRSPRPI